MPVFQRICIIGAGAWGTALANATARTGHKVTLYDNDTAVMAEIEKYRTNRTRLPDIEVDSGITVAQSLREAATADVLLLVIPTQAMRPLAGTLAVHIVPKTPIVTCSKGIERGTGKFVTEIVAEQIPQARPAILSGPSFAVDVAKGLPTAVTLAAEDERLAASLAEALRSPTFRVYHTTDVRGVEIGGAAKNVLAIAAGIVAGRNLGASAQAALTARGFAELVRLGHAYGAKPETLMGLSGLGDLILTCSSPQSRNYALGLALGRGISLAEAGGGKLAEGAFTASALAETAHAKGIDMPIAEAVDDVLAGRLDIDGAIARLLSRPMGAEA
jgi:glycerol-3-phosphate dehydrogenase (NAD(P)+)